MFQTTATVPAECLYSRQEEEKERGSEKQVKRVNEFPWKFTSNVLSPETCKRDWKI